MERTDNLTQARTLALEVSFCADTNVGLPKKLAKIREQSLALIVGIDPNGINRESPEYRYGVCDTILATINDLEIQRLSSTTIALLQKPGHAHVMLAADEESGQSVPMFTKHTGLSKTATKDVVVELIKDGLLEPMPIKSGKRFYRPTAWGKKAAAWIRYQPAVFGVEIRLAPLRTEKAVARKVRVKD